MFRVVQQFVVVENFDPEWELVIDDAESQVPWRNIFVPSETKDTARMTINL